MPWLYRRRQPGVFLHRRVARGDDQLPVEPERLDATLQTGHRRARPIRPSQRVRAGLGGSLAAGLSQEAGLALAIALIGSPSAEIGAAAASGSGGGGGARRAGGTGQSLSQNSGQSGSTAGDGGGEDGTRST